MDKRLHLNMAISAALWLCQAVSAQNVISVNFDGQAGTGTPGPVTGVAGQDDEQRPVDKHIVSSAYELVEHEAWEAKKAAKSKK